MRHQTLPSTVVLLLAGTGLLMSAPADAQRARRDPPLAKKLRQLSEKAPITVAHRGASHDYPENTLPAFRAAVEARASMVELDFRQTADGTLIILHDATLDRTTDSEQVLGKQKVALAATTLADTARLDAGSWKDARFADTRIPTLSAALDVIQKGSITMIEHKAGDPEKLVALLRDKKLVDDVLVQSFDWEWLERVHALEPRLTIGALGSKELTSAKIRALPQTGASMVHWSADSLTVENVVELHDRGYLVCVYTIDDDIRLLGAATIGVDAITTNQPAHLRALTAAGHVRRR